MKKYYHLLFCLAAIIITSCNNNPKSEEESNGPISVENYYIVPNVTMGEDIGEGMLPDGIESGIVEEYVGENKIEQNLVSQHKSYSRANMMADHDNLKDYLYDGIARYFHKMNPDVSIDEAQEEIVNAEIETIQDAHLNDFLQLADMNIALTRPIRKVCQDETVVFVFEVATNVSLEEIKFHKSTQSIGISTDGGTSWKFMTMTDDTPNILRLDFSDEFVNKVMGY